MSDQNSISNEVVFGTQSQSMPAASDWSNGNVFVQVQPTGMTLVIPYDDSNQHLQYGFIAIAGALAVAYLIRSFTRLVEVRKS